MIETLLLVVALAGNPSDPTQSVLALRSGQVMRVLSYEISDTMVLVRSLDNEPLSIRKERIDLERSAELTRQLRERQTKYQEQTAVPLASPVPKTEKPARRHKPSERWRAGSLSTMSSDNAAASDRALELLTEDWATEQADVSEQDDKTREEKQRWQAELAHHRTTLRAAQKRVAEVNSKYRRAHGNAKLTGAGWKTAFELERKLESATQDFDQKLSKAREFLERAKRQKVPRGWLR